MVPLGLTMIIWQLSVVWSSRLKRCLGGQENLIHRTGKVKQVERITLRLFNI